MISIIVPYHDMQNGAFFLKRCLDSIMMQTYKDYEIVLVKEGLMAANTNAGIRKAKGEIIKILFMDDYLAHENSLDLIARTFTKGWLVTACSHDTGNGLTFNAHHPAWNDEMAAGNNTIGSPSVLAFENNNPELFDENLSWSLDCDLYMRLFKRYGMPTILNDINVVIGIGDHQTTHTMSDEQKIKEVEYTINKHL